jgi:hypothetical protein
VSFKSPRSLISGFFVPEPGQKSERHSQEARAQPASLGGVLGKPPLNDLGSDGRQHGDEP